MADLEDAWRCLVSQTGRAWLLSLGGYVQRSLRTQAVIVSMNQAPGSNKAIDEGEGVDIKAMPGGCWMHWSCTSGFLNASCLRLSNRASRGLVLETGIERMVSVPEEVVADPRADL